MLTLFFGRDTIPSTYLKKAAHLTFKNDRQKVVTDGRVSNL
jgi:hypothetical protein